MDFLCARPRRQRACPPRWARATPADERDKVDQIVGKVRGGEPRHEAGAEFVILIHLPVRRLALLSLSHALVVGGSVLEAEAVGQLLVLGGVLVDKALEELAQKVAVEGSGGNDGHENFDRLEDDADISQHFTFTDPSMRNSKWKPKFAVQTDLL